MNLLIISPDQSLPDFIHSAWLGFENNTLNWKVLEKLESLEATFFDKFNLIISEVVIDGQPVLPWLQKEGVTKPLIFIGEAADFDFGYFEESLFDFWLRPIQQKAIQRTWKKLEAMKDIFQSGISKKLFKQRFLAKVCNRLTLVPSEKISCFYSESGMTFLVEAHTNQKHLIDHSLNELESELLDPDKFFRINRSFIVNLEYLSELKPFQNGRLLLSMVTKTDEPLIVAREKVTPFKAWLDQ